MAGALGRELRELAGLFLTLGSVGFGGPAARRRLDGVTAASLALMAVVTWQLGRAAIDGPVAVLLVIGSLLLLRAGVNSALLILVGAAVGLVRS